MSRTVTSSVSAGEAAPSPACVGWMCSGSLAWTRASPDTGLQTWAYTLHQGYTQVHTFGKLQLQLSIAHCTVQEDLANWDGCLQDQREEFSAKNYSQQQVGHETRGNRLVWTRDT